MVSPRAGPGPLAAVAQALAETARVSAEAGSEVLQAWPAVGPHDVQQALDRAVESVAELSRAVSADASEVATRTRLYAGGRAGRDASWLPEEPARAQREPGPAVDRPEPWPGRPRGSA